jgi:hypothetical protein
VFAEFLTRVVYLSQETSPNPSPAPSPSTTSTVVDAVSSFSSLGPLAGLSSGALVFLLVLSWKHILIMPVKAHEDQKAQWDATTLQERAESKRERDVAEADRTREREGLSREIEGLQKTNKDLTQFLFTEVIPAVTKVAGPLEQLEKIHQDTLDELRRRGQT